MTRVLLAATVVLVTVAALGAKAVRCEEGSIRDAARAGGQATVQQSAARALEALITKRGPEAADDQRQDGQDREEDRVRVPEDRQRAADGLVVLRAGTGGKQDRASKISDSTFTSMAPASHRTFASSTVRITAAAIAQLYLASIARRFASSMTDAATQ